VILQYNPFSFGRRGFAPDLVRALATLRRRSRLVVLVHERYVDAVGYKGTLMSTWQRAQLAAVCALATRTLVTVAAYRDSPWVPHLKHAGVLPVGSNVPDMRHRRQETREGLFGRDPTFVVATFGQRHPGRQTAYVAEAMHSLRSRLAGGVMFLNLGATAPRVPMPAGVSVIEPGSLDDGGTAELLSAADLFLAPFVDGVSTRRTTVMAALQHAIPVVGTRGSLTDGSLALDAGLVLADGGCSEKFVLAATQLAESPEEARSVALAGRQLYEREFEWPVLARRLLAELHSRG
jgi:glycosyltransferase involved in cell wall biosynthesis